jgi:hypothetical protein
MNWRLVCLLCLLAPNVAALSVATVGYVPVRWNTSELSYYLELAGSDDLSPEESLEAVNRAFESWMEIECSDLLFEFSGDAPDPNASMLAGAGANGQNDIVWIEDSTWTFGSYVLGITAPLYVNDAIIYEADIAFNGLEVTWKVSGGGQWKSDVESVAVHEIGHFFGLQHNLGPYDWSGELPTMHPSVLSKNKSRSLEEDDVMGACFLYPQGGEWNCVDDEQCPMIVSNQEDGDEYYAGAFLCNETTGLCSDVELFEDGVSQLGESCEEDLNCVGELYCQPWVDGSLCTHYCLVEDGGCEPGYTCSPFENYPEFGVCLPDSGEINEPSGKGLDCQGVSDCEPGEVCLPTPEGDTSLCTVMCLLDDDASCPDGQICWSYNNGKETGGCFEPSLVPGADNDGTESEDVPEDIPEDREDSTSESGKDEHEDGTEQVSDDESGEVRNREQDTAGGDLDDEQMTASEHNDESVQQRDEEHQGDVDSGDDSIENSVGSSQGGCALGICHNHWPWLLSLIFLLALPWRRPKGV